MRVLVVGASGFIGSAVVAKLAATGHHVLAVTRRTSRFVRRLPASEFVSLDIASVRGPADWLPHLRGVDAVVNCAGLLQSAPGASTEGVHVGGVERLAEACEEAGVRRFVHLSAIGADREQPTEFSRTKAEGEAILMRRNVDWVILRPSVVVGRPAYGGSALFRGLAALPVLPVMPNSGPLQVVHLDDLTETIRFFVEPHAPSRIALDIAGPEQASFTEVVLTFRRWLGWREPRLVKVPDALAGLLYAAGDFAGWLGWRPPIRSTARREIVRGAVGDSSEWRRVTGIEPRSLSQALAMEPASVQERWFARLYFLKPLGFAVFSAFWIATAFVSLGPGWEIGRDLMFRGGVGDPFASLTVVAGALTDLLIGIAIAFRRTARLGLYAALLISVAYMIIGSILVPELWREPLGPMLKIWPIMAFSLFLLAVREDR